MANLKTEVILSMNGKAAIQVLEALRDKAKAVREEIDNLDKDAPDFKERKAGLESVYKTLQNYQTNIIKDTERLDHALKNLSTTSLQNLRKALGDGRRQLQKLSEDDLAQAEEVRKKMKLIGDEVRLLEGQYVKIAEGLKNVKNQSDQWLDKAIKQQRDLVGSLEKTDASYQKNYSILKQLEAEEDRRRGKMSKNDAMATVSNKYANASELRRAKATITEVRDKTDSHKVGEIEQYNKALQEIDRRLGSISGQFVDVQKGIGNVSNQSDQWLDKAIKQQRDLVGSLEKSDASYQQNLATLKQLEAEEDRRRGKMSEAEAHQTVTSQNASASDLRRAKTTLTEARDATPTKFTGNIEAYNNELQEIEKRLEAVSGKAQQATMSWKQMKRVLSEPNKASGEDIKRTMEVIAQKIQQLPAGGKYVATLRRQYAMLEQTLKGTRLSQSALNDILARSKQGKASLDELRRAYKQLEEELNQINTKSKEFANRQKSMKELKKNIDEATGAVNKHGNSWQTALRNLTAYVGLFAVFNQVKSIITGLIKKNLDYSGSLTDIRKVAGLAKEDIDDLSRSLAKIETRTSTEGLAKLAYEGAKLGMSKYGVEGMSGFVRAADKINVAIGEEMGEEALPALSKMVEVMGLIPKLGVERALLSTGSAMFKLSSSSTATSAGITEFAKRMTGVARTAGMTTDQLLALASSADAMMLMPEVASTAMSKFVVALQRNHNIIEKDLSIPAGTIKSYYEQGRAIDAVVLVLEKMKEKGNMNALGEIFKDVGGEGQRLIASMVTMSKNVDMLKEHLDIANEAFREGTAISAEYEMQQTSAIGTLERANNLWEKAFVNPDGVDLVKELAQAWYDVSKFLTENAVAMKSFRLLFEGIIVLCKMLVSILPALLVGLTFKGATAALSGINRAFNKMGQTTFIAILRTEGLAAAFKRLSFAMKANWISLLIGGLTEAGVLLYQFVSKQKEVAKTQLDINQYVEEGAAAWDTERRKIDSYVSAIGSATTSAERRKDMLKNFNREYKPYLDKLGLEVNSVEDLKNAYSQLNDEIRKKMYYQIREKARNAELGKARGEIGKAVIDYSKYINSDAGSRWAAYDTKYLEDQVLGGKNTEQIYRQMVEDVYGKGGTWSDYNGDYVLKNESVRDSKLKSLIAQFVRRQEKYNSTKKLIDDALNPLVDDYDPFAGDRPGTLENNAPDQAAARDKRDRERSWREELKQKQDEANAIMDNVRKFYERQINAKMQQAISLGMNKTEQDLFVEPVKRRMNEALEQVCLAIAGQANTWEQFKLAMKDDLIEQTDETGVNLSESLLESITSYDVDALRKKLEELANSLKLPYNSVLAEVFAKATKNAQSNLKLETQQQEARRKAIQEHDYTGIVQQNAYDIFNTMGYANPTKAEMGDKAAFDKRKGNIIAMFEKARTDISKVFGYDMSKEEDRGLLMQLLFGDDPDGMGERIAKTLGKDAGEWQAFYQKLIQYNDEYESASKKRDDERKKLNDYAWSKDSNQKLMQATIDYQGKQNKESSRKYSFGAKGDTILPWEQTEATDPELALLKLKFDLAKEYYKYIEAHNGTEEQKVAAARSIAEAHDAIMDSVASKAKATAEAQMKWYKPIEKYGTALGEAMYDESKTVKKASRDMINSFIDMTGEYVQQKLTQWIMTKLYNSLMASSEQELATTKQDAAIENASTSVSEAGVEVAAGTASGAAKTIGQLGWWGIPLVAVIGAVLGGLLSLAKGALSNSFGGNKNTAKTNNIKVTSGMLTYDSGNVQGMMPYVSESGDFYLATPHNGQHRGVSLLTQPTATTINGQPSLVAENGPEIVIGRETTRAMQMNNPQLLRALVNFDRNFSGRKAYDAGNLSEAATADPTGASVQELIAYSAMANMALQEAVTTLLKRLDAPIEAKINMYGYGQLYDSMKKAERFMRNK